ncbi:unnamed protein product [Clavelina lepadiformis]|uniref:Uncharacterized protein n=1 Tax=Clavelina lepadiformis TaxID=159417 RepID=A0ABP0FX21_CLALP
MPYLRFTMTLFNESSSCAYSASVTPGFEREVLQPILEVLRSFYRRICLYNSEQVWSSRCMSFEFDDPAQREHVPRLFAFHQVISTDDLHVVLVDKLERIGWKWIFPNEISCNPITNKSTITWTFRTFTGSTIITTV